MMGGESKITTNHEVIRRWVEERGGLPAAMKQEVYASAGEAILRIDFTPAGDAETLEMISWNEFFRKFEEDRLAFLYQETAPNGQLSHQAKFISRNGKTVQLS
jgi:hypothetical protein